jgi:hypothetical protein
LNIEIGLQDVDNRTIGHPPTVGKASSFQESKVFFGYGLAEFVGEPGFSDPGLRDDGKYLASALLGPFKAIQQKFKLALPAHKRSQASFRANFGLKN